MKIWIMRHGFAGAASPDPKKERDRELLPEGKAMVLAVAKAMVDADESPVAIFCSPFTRAVQSADIVGKTLGLSVNVIGEMAPVRPLTSSLVELLQAPEKLKRVMLVGHVDNTTPAMNDLDGDGEWKPLVMAECRRVKMDRKDLSWKLRWQIRPSDLGLKDYDK